MSVQDEIKRITAPDILARKGGEPIVCLTSYHAHTARIVDKHCDVILVGDSLGMVMHGLRDHGAGHARHDDPARPRGDARLQARAGGGRHAVRLLRGVEGTGLHERRARAEGNRLRRHQGRRRRAHGGDHRLSDRARRAGDGPCRPDAAVDQHHRFVPRAGPRGGRLGPHRGGHHCRGRGRRVFDRDRGGGRAAGPQAHRRGARCRPSASAPASPATARSW